MNGIVFDIKRYAIHDGPGIRTTVFFKGCPLQCGWCQNPESQDASPQLCLAPDRCIRCGACLEACPNGGVRRGEGSPETDRVRCVRCGACAEACPSGARSMLGTVLSVPRLMAEIDRDRVFYDESGGGVTFSGGEPLMQPDFLRACLESCKQQNYHTALDTCGHAPSDTFLGVVEYTDLFLYDLKIMDDARHQQFLGVSNALMMDNLRRLCRRERPVWLRFPLIPGINDDLENLRATAEFVRSLGRPLRLFLLPYHRIGSSKYNRLGMPYTAEGIEPPTSERVHDIAGQLSAMGLDVKIGG